MKVLHMLQSSHFSGAENVVCQIISLLKQSGIEFVYCSQDGQIREALEERKIDFHPIKKMSIGEFRRVICEVKPDIIHAHDMGASFFAALTCGKIPLISHIHNNAINSRGVSIKSILYFMAATKAKHIFWVSRSSYEGYVFAKCFSNKSSVLYNIIDIKTIEEKMILDTHDYNYDIVYLGRLTQPKNPLRLIEVIEKIVKRKSSVKVAVIGEGEMEDAVKELSRTKGISKNIDYLGFQNNPFKILHDSKVMMMTSLWEGTPMCALEAMSLGVPIVSTPTDGLCELVSVGKTGFLSDKDDELADYCLQIICNQELHDCLSKNSIERAYLLMDLDRYRDELIKYYHQPEV